ncbi:MAG: LAGLIDADG family homing endonuclease [Candidatus Hadarchaeales archaeon]
MPKPERSHGKKALEKLADLGKIVLEEIEKGQPPKLRIPSRSTSNIVYDEKNGYFVLGPRYGIRTAGSMKQVKKFAQLLCTAEFAKELIEQKKFATLREMYYTAEGWETGPFRDQGESDLMVEDLEATFGVKRENMGLVPEEDGAAVYGQITIREDNAVIDATKAGRGGYTIPPTIDDVEFLRCRAKRVIAIETMGMYHRFVQEEAWKKFDALIVGLKGQAARATRRFLKRANEELGLPVYLFCLHGDEPVLVMKDGNLKMVKVREVAENFRVFKDSGVVSFSMDGKPVVKPIVRAIRREDASEMYEITLEGGYSIRVTDDHPMIVFDGKRFRFRLACEVKEGDLIPVCFGLPNNNRMHEIDILDLISEALPDLLKKIHAQDDWVRWGKSELRFPRKLPLTPELCRLLGYFAAEGCISRGQITISFGKHEKEYIEDVMSCVKKIFGCTPHAHPTNPSSVSINFGGNFLAEFFQKVLRTGEDAYSKRVPDIIFNAPDELKMEFLRGYFRGDGSYRPVRSFRSLRSLWAKTVSRELAAGILNLIIQLGGFATVRSSKTENPGRTYVIEISNAKTLRLLSKIVRDLGGETPESKSSKDPFVFRFPSHILAQARGFLRILLRGRLGRLLPPAAWKDGRISYDRLKRIIQSAPLKKTAKVLLSLARMGKGEFTSSQLITDVNSTNNPGIHPSSVRSILNHLRRYGFVEVVGGRCGGLKSYRVTERFEEIKNQMQILERIGHIVENRVGLIPVKRISKVSPNGPVYDLEVADTKTVVAGLGPIGVGDCDGDPFGFHIAMVVISGSAKLAYINHELAVPDAKYIGVTASDIVNYSLPTDKLRELDIARLKQLQKDPRYNTDFWQTEIKKMMELGRKAEQQAFAKYGLAYVVNEYLPAKLKEVEGEKFLGKA